MKKIEKERNPDNNLMAENFVSFELMVVRRKQIVHGGFAV